MGAPYIYDISRLRVKYSLSICLQKLEKTVVQTSDSLVQIPSVYVFLHDATTPKGPTPHFPGFTITLRYTTLGRSTWASDQPDTKTSPWLRTTLTRNTHTCCRLNSNPHPSKPAAADARLRPRGHWDWPIANVLIINIGQGWPTVLYLGHIQVVQPRTI
jgi:hypothetical protein